MICPLQMAMKASKKMFLCDRAHQAPQNGLFSILLIRLLADLLSNPSFQD